MRPTKMQKEVTKKLEEVLQIGKNTKSKVIKKPLLESSKKQLLGRKKLLEREINRIDIMLS